MASPAACQNPRCQRTDWPGAFDDKRPDGATMVPWARGRCIAWDVTVPDTLAPSHVQASATRAGTVAKQSEALKITKYASIAISIPLSHSPLKHWGRGASRRSSLLQSWAGASRRSRGTREKPNSSASASRSPFSAAMRWPVLELLESDRSDSLGPIAEFNMHCLRCIQSPR